MRHCKVILLYWKLFRKMCKGSDVKIPSQALAFVKIKLERHVLIIICVGDVEFNLALQGGGQEVQEQAWAEPQHNCALEYFVLIDWVGGPDEKILAPVYDVWTKCIAGHAS